MFVLMSPWLIPIAVFLGGILSPILGWARAYRDAKKVGDIEKLNIRRDSASATDGWIVGKIKLEKAGNLVGKYYIEYMGK